MTSLDPFKRAVPPLARVQQKLRGEHIANVRTETRQKLLDAGLKNKIKPGDKIAITAGSRGIGGFVELLNGIVEAVTTLGGKPIIVPAMGSHGGATAEGQAEVLRRLGVAEGAVPAPVQATMATVPLGRSDSGAVAHLDEIVSKADGVIVLGRVKTHPENAEGVASGLLKMTTVGLGKQMGAQEAHSHGLWESVEAVPKITFAKTRILCGVAVVENAFRQPVEIEVVPGNYDAFLDADKRLLKVAAPHVAKIPFQKLDLLIVDELGKTVSGTGMDLNVIGSWRMKGGKREPDYFRIVALSLTAGSAGNGLGIGLADFTTERFAREFDFAATYVNLLTATEPNAMNTNEGRLPLALSNDREAIEVALHSTLAKNNPRICRIKSTAALHEFFVSETLLQEVEKNPALEILEEPKPLLFDHRGNLF